MPVAGGLKQKTMKEKFKEFVAAKRAVSPVIGVVLMVAVVVILAAVIGAFVLGLGGSQTTTPQASFTYDNGVLTMSAGESIPVDQISLEDDAAFDDADGDDLVEAGDTATTADSNGDGVITVTWTSADGSESAVLASIEVGDGGTGDDGTN
jgi:flagellin-like protein